MRTFTAEDIRRCFATSTDFNEIFDAFQSALAQNLRDLEAYRRLFWNHALSPDEVRLFGEKLATHAPDVAHDVYLWLARMFEATLSETDNYELAFLYYRKAARARPETEEPYLGAAACYEADLNIPPLGNLIEFLREGTGRVGDPRALYRRLAHLHELAGDPDEADTCRRLAERDPGAPSP